MLEYGTKWQKVECSAHLFQDALLLMFRDEVGNVEHLWRQTWNLLLLQQV